MKAYWTVILVATACGPHTSTSSTPANAQNGAAVTSSESAAASTSDVLSVSSAVLQSGNPTLAPAAMNAADANLIGDLQAGAGVSQHVARALRQIANDPTLCASGSAVVASAGNQTASCSNIGQNGSYSGGGTLTLTNCVLKNGAELNGSVTTTMTEALVSGATCGPTAAVDVTHSQTADLTYTSPKKSVTTYSGLASNSSLTYALGSAPSSYTLTVTAGEYKRTNASGTVVVDQKPSGTATVTISAGTRTTNGNFNLTDVLTGGTSALTETNVVQSDGCCAPTGGTATLTETSSTGSATAQTTTYGPTCGAISINGTATQSAAQPWCHGHGQGGGHGSGHGWRR